MTKRLLDVRQEPVWLDIASYGRGSAGQRGSLRLHYEAISRTTGGVPEVMVKVTGGGKSVQQVRDEIDYFGRNGELEIETDDGQRLRGAGIDKQLVKDWGLDLEALRGRTPYTGKSGRRSPKIVYNLMFSMPPGTPPQKVLAATRKFAFEKFALSHRYAMVLHTDEKHPHVHMLVKARNEEGIRLHITKPMLREWRQEFARYLRELGVAANATDRKSRGQTKPRKKDAIYRAHLRGESTHMRARVESVATDLVNGQWEIEPGKKKLLVTRGAVQHGWMAIGAQLRSEGQAELAVQVRKYVREMQAPKTEREWLAFELERRLLMAKSEQRELTR